MGGDYSSFKELIFQHYKSFGNKTAFHTIGRKEATYSFNDFVGHIKKVSEYLKRLSTFQSRSNVALVGTNSYEWLIAAISVICSDNCVVPVDSELSDEDILEQVSFADCDLILCSKDFRFVFKDNANVITLQELFDRAVNGQKSEQEYKIAGRHYLPNDDTAMIVFTSGTTAAPKGVRLSEKNIIAVVKGSNNYLRPVGKVFCFLPLYHTYSFSCGILGTLAAGEQIILNDTMRNFTKNLKNSEPRMIFAVPLVLDRIKQTIITSAENSGKLPAFNRMRKLSGFLLKFRIDIRKKLFHQILEQVGGELDTVICGGAPLSGDTISFFRDIGITVLNGYGITECAPLVAVVTNKERSKARDGSVGKPIYTCNVMLASTNKDGEGEILVSGENVMQGYYKNQAATDSVIRDGWLYTGDIGCFDKYGDLYIKSRKKNMILLGNGKNVYPEEIEDMLIQINGISEVIVYLGNEEKITAEVFSEAGESAYDNIRDKITETNKRLPLYAQIKNVVFRNEPFEKTTSQKIKRR